MAGLEELERCGTAAAAPRVCDHSAATACGWVPRDRTPDRRRRRLRHRRGTPADVSVPASPSTSARPRVGRAQRLGQPARAAQQPLGLLRHVGLLEMVDQLRRRLALRLPHRFEDARLRNPAEIIVDGRGPAGRRHVEVHRAGQRVGMSEAPRAAVPRLMHGVDAERGAMREQRRLAVAIERHQRRPRDRLRPWATALPIADGGPRSPWRRRCRPVPAPGR